MTPERWQHIHAVFNEALRYEAGERPAVLARACAGDDALRAEVAGLLAQDEEAERNGFLGSTWRQGGLRLRGAQLLGCRLGPYEVRAHLGSGGMGDVYRAARVDDYAQEVALKVVRPGLGGEVAQRFRTERQVLAELRHPHIARLLDGGTTPDGLPYLVMELLGPPIDRHCDADGLPLRQRVRLLHAVCLAVAHAHEKGILHRDLKPSNVLVAADGTPRVTDFGLAKHFGVLEAADAAGTQTGQVLGTPSYMAPEQAAGRPAAVGPATDVWALGAILYELLTGRPPFKADTPRETLDQVCTREPVAPARLQPGVPRDLETVCLKCLEKEPARRYQSARDLADDLARFLEGQPVRARPLGRVGRAVRWARRNPRVAGLLAALLLVFVGGFAGTTTLWLAARAQGEEARRQRERAEAREKLARRAVDDLTRVAEQLLAGQPRLTAAHLEVLERALASYLELVQQGHADAGLRFKTAQAYHFVGRVYNRVGRLRQGERCLRQQLALLQELTAEVPDERRYRFDLFHCRLVLCTTLQVLGRDAEGEEQARQALELIRGLVHDFPGEPLYRDALAHQAGRLGSFLEQRGQLEEAERLYREGLALARKLVAEQPRRRQEPSFEANVANNLRALAGLDQRRGRLDRAEKALREVIVLSRGQMEDHPEEPGHAVGLAVDQITLADLLRQTGRFAEAEALGRQALARIERGARDHPLVWAWRANLPRAHDFLGQVLFAAGRHAEAEQAFRRTVVVWEETMRDFPDQVSLPEGLAWLLCLCPVERVRDPGRALALARRVVARDPGEPGHWLGVALAYHRLGKWRECLAALDRAGGHGNEAVAAFLRAMACWHQGERRRARQCLAEARRLARAQAPGTGLQALRAEAAALLGGR
jgi:serine/threonine-protein kinase